MSRLLRITLTWLLALAIPVQGYAAQAVLTGGIVHQATMTAHQGGMAMHQHESHAHAPDASVGAQQDADCCDEDDLNAAAHGGSTHGKCSTCASSCGAVAITTPMLSMDVASYGMTMVATVAVVQHHFLTGGIERPPRTPLA